MAQRTSCLKTFKIMKKITAVFVVLLLLSQTGKAQDKAMKFGFQVSPGVSWIKPDMKGVDNGSPGFAFEFGAMADIQLTDNIALSTGLGGEFNGGQLKFNDVAVPLPGYDDLDSAVFPSTATYNMRYVKIPLTFKGKTNQIGYMTYFLEFGGAAGFNFRSRMSIKNPVSRSNEEIETEDIDVSKPLRVVRFSMVIRAGVEYNLSGNTSLVLGATFDNGLTNTFSKNNSNKFEVYEADGKGYPKVNNSTGDRIKGEAFNAITNAISLNVGVLF